MIGFLVAWGNVVAETFIFVALCALLVGAMLLVALPAILMPSPWGIITTVSLVFIILTMLLAVQDIWDG